MISSDCVYNIFYGHNSVCVYILTEYITGRNCACIYFNIHHSLSPYCDTHPSADLGLNKKESQRKGSPMDISSMLV